MIQGKERGDSIIGVLVICEARAISKPILIHKSGKHRAQRIRCIGYPALCWIDRPFRERK